MAIHEALVLVANAALGGGTEQPSQLNYIDSDEDFDRVMRDTGLG